MAPLDRIIGLLHLAEWTRPDDSRIDVADLIGQSADPVATASAWQRRSYGFAMPALRLRPGTGTGGNDAAGGDRLAEGDCDA